MNKFLIILMMLVGMTLNASAQKYQRYYPAADMYMFGVSFSVSDSTVYFTEIKQVANTSVERGTGFLYSRNSYSGQLQQYIKSTSASNYTSVVCYAQKRGKLEKKFSKMRQKYQKKNFVVKYIDSGFKFSPVTYKEQDAE